MKVVCLYDVAVVKCHNASCRVCKRVPEAAGRIESLHRSVLLDMLQELDQKIEKKNQAFSFFFFFVFILIPRLQVAFNLTFCRFEFLGAGHTKNKQINSEDLDTHF